MATFPRSEAEIEVLARAVIAGMKRSPEDYASGPLRAEELEAILAEFRASHEATIEADAVATQRHGAKDDSQRKLVSGLKTQLRYAEAVNRGHPDKLRELGWGPPRARTAPEAPGQVAGLTIRAEGPSWVMLDWEPPATGGAVAAYKIERRNRKGDMDWEPVATSPTPEMFLNNQPRGVELEYRVIAFNKTGEGAVSSTATLVL